MKISNYTQNNYPDPENDFLVDAETGLNYKVHPASISLRSNISIMKPIVCDFVGSVNNEEDFIITNAQKDDGFENHPGLIESSLGVGAEVKLYDNIFLLKGGEVVEAIAYLVNDASDAVFGFRDSVGGAIDGAWINLSADTITGKTSSNNVQSTTASSFTIVSGTWYRVKVSISNDVSQVDFFVYDENDALLWSDTLFTNIPNVAGRETSVYAALGAAGASKKLDWLAFYSLKELTR